MRLVKTIKFHLCPSDGKVTNTKLPSVELRDNCASHGNSTRGMLQK